MTEMTICEKHDTRNPRGLSRGPWLRAAIRLRAWSLAWSSRREFKKRTNKCGVEPDNEYV